MGLEDSIDLLGNDRRNRGTFEMIAALLSTCNQPANKNQIMQRANFSSSAVKYYLELALRGGLVELLKNGTFTTTEKGRNVIAKYAELMDLLEDSDVQSGTAHNKGRDQF